MATSGTFAFNPGLGELGLYAFNLIEIRSTALLQEHMESLRMAANLMQSRWSAQGVNLWAVDLQSIPLIQGQATYTIPADTIVMLDAYVVQNSVAPLINRIILPISRTEYASYPNPLQQGFPTTFWMDRLLAPTVTLWPVPDGEESTLNYYRLRQIQDATLTGGTQLEIPYYFLEAAAYGLAQRLATIWKPEKFGMLKALADEAYSIAADQNTETANFYISPMTGGYYTV